MYLHFQILIFNFRICFNISCIISNQLKNYFWSESKNDSNFWIDLQNNKHDRYYTVGQHIKMLVYRLISVRNDDKDPVLEYPTSFNVYIIL